MPLPNPLGLPQSQAVAVVPPGMPKFGDPRLDGLLAESKASASWLMPLPKSLGLLLSLSVAVIPPGMPESGNSRLIASSAAALAVAQRRLAWNAFTSSRSPPAPWLQSAALFSLNRFSQLSMEAAALTGRGRRLEAIGLTSNTG